MVKKNNIRKNFFLDTSSLALNPYRSILSLAASSVPDELLRVVKESDQFIHDVLEVIGPELKDGNPNDIFIPDMTYWELNNLKDDPWEEPTTKFRMRRALSFISNLTIYGDRKKGGPEYLTKNGITLPNGSVVRIVSHDESEFKDYSKNKYQPTRDDIIIHDCFNYIKKTVANTLASNTDTLPKDIKGNLDERIKRIIKDIEDKDLDLAQRYDKKTLSGLVFQFVTEDSGFPKVIMDRKGRLAYGLNIDVQPLLMERTSSPNPAKVYTGIAAESLMLSNDYYEQIYHAKGFIKINELIGNSLNKRLRKSLPDIKSLRANQYILIIPQSPDILKKAPSAYHLRKPTDDSEILVPLEHYQRFMKRQAMLLDNYASTPESDDLEQKLSSPVKTTSEAHALVEGLKGRMSNKETKQYHNKLSKLKKLKNPDPKLREIVDEIKSKAMVVTEKKPDKNYLNDWRSRPFNPFIMPTLKQQPYIDSLNNPDIPITLVLGTAGTGKTHSAIEIGLDWVRQGKADCVLYARPTITQGQNQGFEPGSFEQKVSHIKLSAMDTLLFLYTLKDFPPSVYDAYPQLKIESGKVADQIAAGPIVQRALIFDVINKMAGRTISNAYVILDEAHLHTRDELIMWLGRPDNVSKLVIIGDPDQMYSADITEIRKKGLTPSQSGVSHFIEDFKLHQNPYTKKYSDLITVLSMYDAEDVKRSVFAEISEAFRKASSLR